MDYISVRKKICKISQLLYHRGLISGGDGNVSIRIKGVDRIIVTPSGYHKGLMEPNDLVVVDHEGRVLSGPKPTSELELHLRVYERRPDVFGIVHAHPPWTTALYLAGKEVNDPPILTEAHEVIGKVSVIPYAAPGSKDLADKVADALMDSRVCVLMNHGVVTCGCDLMEAFMLMESLENCSKVTVFTHLLGGPQSFISIPESPSKK
ncbi:class II aldolase/adducin family protein [Dissulfuribacter thermophilus]|nr:class II aldolase/adducin family protein [Dissulfuribacter thermophilus]